MSALVDTVLGFATGGVGGLIARVVPEVLSLFRSKADRDHEYRMAQLQISNAQADRDARAFEATLAFDAKHLEALASTARAQARPTGVKWVDALSASVRPVTTYWWMAFYTVYKAAVLAAAYRQSADWVEMALQAWTPWDAATMGGILAFWYLDRAIKHGRA